MKQQHTDHGERVPACLRCVLSLQVTIGFLQLIALFAKFPIAYPETPAKFYDTMSFSNLNVDLFSPEVRRGRGACAVYALGVCGCDRLCTASTVLASALTCADTRRSYTHSLTRSCPRPLARPLMLTHSLARTSARSQCSAPLSYWAKRYVKLSVPFVFLAMFGMYYAIWQVRPGLVSGQRQQHAL